MLSQKNTSFSPPSSSFLPSAFRRAADRLDLQFRRLFLPPSRVCGGGKPSRRRRSRREWRQKRRFPFSVTYIVRETVCYWVGGLKWWWWRQQPPVSKATGNECSEIDTNRFFSLFRRCILSESEFGSHDSSSSFPFSFLTAKGKEACPVESQRFPKLSASKFKILR